MLVLETVWVQVSKPNGVDTVVITSHSVSTVFI